MGNISLWQIAILTVYAGFGILEGLGTQLALNIPLFAGFFTGLIMGDPILGLTVGATLQLTTLGVATYGGAAVPDFFSAAIIGTTYGILSGQGIEYAIGIAVPIGLLLTQLDILARMSNTMLSHKAEKYADDGNADGVARTHMYGIIFWSLSRAVPIFIALMFGEAVVSTINQYIPVWLMSGLKVSGKLLPAMGIAILMRYLPIKKLLPFFIIGFTLFSFGKVNMLGVAIIGLALAWILLFLNKNNTQQIANNAKSVDDEEVEIDE